jgi:hypothetical protein
MQEKAGWGGGDSDLQLNLNGLKAETVAVKSTKNISTNAKEKKGDKFFISLCLSRKIGYVIHAWDV